MTLVPMWRVWGGESTTLPSGLVNRLDRVTYLVVQPLASPEPLSSALAQLSDKLSTLPFSEEAAELLSLAWPQ